MQKEILARVEPVRRWGGIALVLIAALLCILQSFPALKQNIVLVEWLQISIQDDLLSQMPAQFDSKRSLWGDTETLSRVGQSIREASVSYPYNSVLNYHLGQINYWLGDESQAIAMLERVPVDDLLFPLANLYLGASYWELGDQEQARAIWKNSPGVEDHFFYLAIGVEFENYSVAEGLYQIACQLDAQSNEMNAGYWFARSMRLLNQQDTDADAVENAVLKAMDLNHNNFQRQLSLGKELYLKGKYPLALLAIQSAVDNNQGGQFWPYYYKGLILYGLEEYGQAFEQLQHVLTLAPDFGRGYHWLARTLAKLNRNDDALEHYQQAVKYLPDDQSLLNEFMSFQKSVSGTK